MCHLMPRAFLLVPLDQSQGLMPCSDCGGVRGGKHQLVCLCVSDVEFEQTIGFRHHWSTC